MLNERPKPPLADLPMSPGTSLTSGLADSLGTRIVRGDFDVSGFPNEGDIANVHAVSRTVVREAVKILTAKGMLYGRPRRGTSLRPRDDWNLLDAEILRWLLDMRPVCPVLRQFDELRLAFEPEAAGLAAVRATAAERDAIAEFASVRQSDETPDGDDYVRFHLAILRASGNPFLMSFGRPLATVLASVTQHSPAAIQSLRLATLPEIASAIRRSDRRVAREAMRAALRLAPLHPDGPSREEAIACRAAREVTDL